MMKKKWILLLIMGMVFVFSGCGKEDKVFVVDKAAVEPEEDKEEPSVETVDEEAMKAAYAVVLNNIYTSRTFPDGQDYGFLEPDDISNNSFAVYDIDSDGREELILYYTTTYMAGMTVKIYDYDEQSGAVREQFSEFPSVTFYDNGVIEAKASHNHGMASVSEDFWPYTLYQYDKSSDSYTKIAIVDAWDKEQQEKDYDGNPFPEEADTDGDGFVYYIMTSGEYKLEEPTETEQYEEWRNSYLGSAKKIDIPHEKLTEENIFKLSANAAVLGGLRIDEQSFEVSLDDWGNVTFASYAPENHSLGIDGLNMDVRFYLMDENRILYAFPGRNENHTTTDQFWAVSAVAFQDYNDDGLKDVITICEYTAMAGKGFQIARVYLQKENRQGFEEDTLLCEYLSKNHLTDSIETVMNAREDYWDYVSAVDGQGSVHPQLTIMAENKELWVEELEYADEQYCYAVTDLDNNGRLELIVSNMGGTGIYTYSRFYEINEAYDGVSECETDFEEGDSEPDLIMDSVYASCFQDGTWYYAVYDMAKNGAGEHYENYRVLSLKDGKITTIPLAYRTRIYDYKSDSHAITCTDASGNTITEEEFEKCYEKFFKDEQYLVTFGWQDVRDLGDDTEAVIAQLDQSYRAFTTKDLEGNDI